MKDQNYRELVRKLHLYLDDNMCEQTQNELLKEIKANPDYLSLLSKEKAFKEFIKRKSPRRIPAPSLIQSIKAHIVFADAKS